MVSVLAPLAHVEIGRNFLQKFAVVFNSFGDMSIEFE